MDTNGTPVAHQLEEARQRLELARLRVRESLLQRLESRPGFDPAARDQDEDGWITVQRGNTQGGINRPVALSESDLADLWANARWITTRNDQAIGALRVLVNYTVRTGYQWQAEPAAKADARKAAPVCEAVQRVLDQFISYNAWQDRERSCVRRAIRDGEVFLRLFTEGWPLAVRFVEPEQVTAPPDATEEWLWGIKTREGDIEIPEAYGVVYSERDGWEEIPASEIYHLKRNVDENVKRGLSDFYSGDETFEGVRKLLRNMRETAAVQAALAWIEQYETADEDSLLAAVNARRDTGRSVETNTTTGKAGKYEKVLPGTVKVVSAGRQYIAAPMATNTTQHIATAQACLRALGVRWNMPEYMISGDASNNAFASSLVAGTPFVVSIETEQDVFRRYWLRVMWDVVRLACDSGRLPWPMEEVEALCDIVGTPPMITTPDPVAQSTADAQDITAGVMSRQTRRERIGLDNDTERQRIAEDPPPAPAPSPGGGNPFAAMLGTGAADTSEPTPAGAPPEQADSVKGNDLRSTVGGLQAIAALQADYYAGKLPREAAIANVKLLFGFSDQEAADLFPATAPVKLTPDPAPAVAGVAESRLQEAISEAYRRLQERLRA